MWNDSIHVTKYTKVNEFRVLPATSDFSKSYVNDFIHLSFLAVFPTYSRRGAGTPVCDVGISINRLPLTGESGPDPGTSHGRPDQRRDM